MKLRKKIFLFCMFILIIGCSHKQKGVDPKVIEENIKKGMKLLILRNYNASKKEFQLILKESPRNIEAHYYLAINNIYLKNMDDAYVNLRTVLELNPEYDLGEGIEITLIRYMFTRGEYNKLEKEINKFYRLYPANSLNGGFFLRVADVYRDKGEFDEALEQYKKVVNDFPDTAYKRTAEEMIKFIEDNSDFNREPLKLFAIAKSKHVIDDTLELFRELVAKYPKARIIPLVKMEIALCYDHGRMNLFESAIVYYQELIDEYPGTEFALMGLKNKKRIEQIFGQKVLSRAHKKEFEKNLKKSSGQK
ncbi:MAG: tetratricopeptide repeat protein [Candidatus Firestonebacteria bacterium]|nr:tetratricopeptide repeat protein [Candidatus Firestonebacteria bacterium]